MVELQNVRAENNPRDYMEGCQRALISNVNPGLIEVTAWKILKLLSALLGKAKDEWKMNSKDTTRKEWCRNATHLVSLILSNHIISQSRSYDAGRESNSSKVTQLDSGTTGTRTIIAQLLFLCFFPAYWTSDSGRPIVFDLLCRWKGNCNFFQQADCTEMSVRSVQGRVGKAEA